MRHSLPGVSGWLRAKMTIPIPPARRPGPSPARGRPPARRAARARDAPARASRRCAPGTRAPAPDRRPFAGRRPSAGAPAPRSMASVRCFVSCSCRSIRAGYPNQPLRIAVVPQPVSRTSEQIRQPQRHGHLEASARERSAHELLRTPDSVRHGVLVHAQPACRPHEAGALFQEDADRGAHAPSCGVVRDKRTELALDEAGLVGVMQGERLERNVQVGRKGIGAAGEPGDAPWPMVLPGGSGESR